MNQKRYCFEYHADKGSKDLKRSVAFVLLIVLSACNGEDQSSGPNQLSNSSSTFYSMLRAIPTAELLLTVQVEGNLVLKAEPLSSFLQGTDESSVVIEVPQPANVDSLPVVTVDVEYQYITPESNTVSLANTTQRIQWTDGLTSVDLDALDYRYNDVDNNGVYDFFSVLEYNKRTNRCICFGRFFCHRVFKFHDGT